MVAGALKDFAGSRKIGPGAQRERITGLFQQWEQRLRKRYKRR
jgi:hypothetical protein